MAGRFAARTRSFASFTTRAKSLNVHAIFLASARSSVANLHDKSLKNTCRKQHHLFYFIMHGYAVKFTAIGDMSPYSKWS
jgi:hypothetical protein